MWWVEMDACVSEFEYVEVVLSENLFNFDTFILKVLIFSRLNCF